jgi:hypothetical protein
MFRAAGWTDAKRHLEVQAEEAEAGRDLDGTQPMAVQVKCWKATPSIAALQEITTDDEYSLPMAILKRTRSKGTPGLEVAVFPLDVAMALLWLVKREDKLWLLQGLREMWNADFAFECPRCQVTSYRMDGTEVECTNCGFTAPLEVFLVEDSDG